jgi:HK97 family phage portal protein
MFNRIREFFARSKQYTVMANVVDVWQANRPLADFWDVKRFAEDGYRRNSIIFSCITVKATAFGQPELKGLIEGVDGDEDLPKGHILTGILGSGLLSGYQKTGMPQRGSQSAFMNAASMHLDVGGNVYGFIERNGQGMPLRVKMLSRPDLVRPVPDSNGEVVRYEYGSPPSAQVIQPQDMIHLMANPDPLEPYRGVSPIAVLARMGDLDNYASDYLRAYFLNAGIPAYMAKFKQQTDKPTRERFKEQWQENYSGVHGWHRMAVTDADIEIEKLGSEVNKMDLSSIFGETESRICGTMGVHPILVAAFIGLQRSTMANYEQARRSLYSDTLLPVWTATADRITTDLAAEFGDNVVCKFQLDEVPELQIDQSQKKKEALDGWNASLITRAEARHEWGYQVNAADDVYKVGPGDSFEPAGAIPVAADVTPPTQQKQIAGRTERLRLIAGNEQHDAVSADMARRLKAIADKASPTVKKKYSRRSSLRRTVRT